MAAPTKSEDLAKQLKLQRELQTLREAEVKDYAAIAAKKLEIEGIEDKLVETAENKKRWAEEELADVQDNLNILQQIADLNDDQALVQSGRLEVAEQQLKNDMLALEALRDQAKETDKITPKLAEQIRLAQEKAKQSKAELESTKEITAAYDGISDSVEGTLNGIMGNVKAKETFIGKLLLAKKHSGGISGVIGQLGLGLKKALNPANIMTGLLFKMQEATLALAFGPGGMDEWRAELAKSGGSLNDYSGLMEDTADANKKAGVSYSQSMKAISGLRETMSDFNGMAEKDKATLVGTAAIMSF